jgi:hypothetical protein
MFQISGNWAQIQLRQINNNYDYYHNFVSV